MKVFSLMTRSKYIIRVSFQVVKFKGVLFIENSGLFHVGEWRYTVAVDLMFSII